MSRGAGRGFGEENGEPAKRRGSGSDDGSVVRDQGASESDQTGSDVDQTAAEADQTAADGDQSASERDQLQADSDERSARRDQLAADRDLPENPSEAVQDAHKLSQEARERSGLERQASALTRISSASHRDSHAAQREDEARKRDQTATARDLNAEVRDRTIFETVERLGAPEEKRLRAATEAAAELRSHAAADRARAAKDRRRAARDREESTLDRQELQAALDAAHLDDLTGAYRRGLGEVILRNELERAQRGTAPLTLVVIDADNLKALNDAGGHAAGDALLRDIAAALRASLRPYDPLVRTGGDEFVCTIAGLSLEHSRSRLAEVSATLAQAQPGASISIGLAEMRADDTLETLIERGDAALYDDKRGG